MYGMYKSSWSALRPSGPESWPSSNYTLSADPAQYDYLAAEGIEAIRVDTDDVDALVRECSGLWFDL